MSETDVAATPAAIASEPSSLGGGGAIELSDEDILGISSEDESPLATPAAEPPKTEEAAPAPEAEGKTEAQPPAPEPVDDLKWMRPLLNDKVFGPKLQSMHDRLLAFQELYPTVSDARAVKELLPGGAEELKTLVAMKKETDEMDFQFFGGDPSEQRPYLENLEREGPEAFDSAVQIGLDIIKQHRPQQWEYLTNHSTGDSLKADKTWEWLEYIYEKATASGATEVAGLIDQFAGLFQKYGLGPSANRDPNQALINQQRTEVERERDQLRAERQRDFNQAAEQAVVRNLNSEVSGQPGVPQLIAKLLPRTSDGLRARIAKDVHKEIEDIVGADAGLKLRVSNLMRSSGINRQTQEQVVNLLASRARQVMKGAVKKIVDEYTASVMASRNQVVEKQNNAASRVDVSSGARPGTGVRPITAEEASKMSDMDILESDRPFVKRR